MAWIEWAQAICRELRDEEPSATSPSVNALDGVDAYLEQWMSGVAGQTRSKPPQVHRPGTAAQIESYLRLQAYWRR